MFFTGFRDFILRGNVVDLAVGVAIGAAFTALVTAFGDSFVEPLVGLFLGGGVEGGTLTVNGQVFDFGGFINALVTFAITGAVVYFLVVLPVNRLTALQRGQPDATPQTKTCPECLSPIPAGARRCASCTAEQPSTT